MTRIVLFYFLSLKINYIKYITLRSTLLIRSILFTLSLPFFAVIANAATSAELQQLDQRQIQTALASYALLLRFVVWRWERNGSEATLKVQTHHQYRFILWAADLELPKLEKRLPRTILSVEDVEQVLALPDLTTLQGIGYSAMGKLPPVPARDGNANAGERRGPAVDIGDAGPCERGEHANLHAGLHQSVIRSPCKHASGRTTGQ
ncbi:hypothetical protein KP22_14290 [Pectobacterium betavasculorum]|uniref:Uncharacterized protein n=1 Tax=Pectobacterium betavasculorum TaxID=55207 RepID=A0A093TCH1_9GAMM|nr:hypothetical protein KP22_14290 [Pectobacterium betavasculorum]KFX20061.1 hypothetical protein JV35_11380 [Pectobacterium betavasculorum]